MTTNIDTGQLDLAPLAISCTQSDCDSGLHCFRKSRQMAPEQVGQCRSCGAQLVDWQRVYQRDVSDATFTFQALKGEWIRHQFWHMPIDDAAENHARRKGRIKLRAAAEHRLRRSIGTKDPTWDGRQTPKQGNILYYAQHALACCCRTCLEYWHNIPQDVELTQEQLDYFVELIMMYVDERMPQLMDSGEKIPPRRKAKGADQFR